MNWKKTSLVTASIVTVVAMCAADRPKADKPKVDKRKYVVEAPLEVVIDPEFVSPPDPNPPKQAKEKVYVSKGFIERPVEALLVETQPTTPLPVEKPLAAAKPVEKRAANPKDFEKRVIERPVEDFVNTLDVVLDAQPTPTGFVNPKVEPGQVRWHGDFAAACAASRKSGKPVLLFQMMGNLDDRFC